MTVYRHFRSKKELLRASLSCIAGVFEAALDRPKEGFEVTMARLGEAMRDLPAGDLPSRLAEVRARYPDLYLEFLDSRKRGVDGLLERLFSDARAKGRLRTDLDQRIMEVFVREATAGVLASPMLLDKGISPIELFTTVKETLLHGILQPPTIRTKAKGARSR